MLSVALWRSRKNKCVNTDFPMDLAVVPGTFMSFDAAEKYQSQIPALQLLVALGFKPLSRGRGVGPARWATA